MGRLSMHGLFGRACLAVTFSFASLSANAQQASVIRDAEMESFLADVSSTVLRSAGVSAKSVRVVVINNRGFDAFVVDGKRIFVNTGTIIDSKEPEELIGVIAHETGHLVGGHLARLRERIKNAQTLAAVGALIGTAGAIASAATAKNPRESIEAAAGIARGASGIARRVIRSYQREEESAADRAAVTFLEKSGISPKGMLEVFQRLSFQGVRLTETEGYETSHPAPFERIAALQSLVDNSRHRDKRVSKSIRNRFKMVQAKLVGFLLGKRQVQNLYGRANDLPAQYAKAISLYQNRGYRAAARDIDALIKAQPNNPYFWELKGQAMLESGRAQDAIGPLKKAVKLSKNNPLISVLLGHALIAAGSDKQLKQAIRVLEKGVIKDKEMPAAFYHLSVAYGRLGNLGEADLALAKSYFLQRNIPGAKKLATRALKKLKKRSRGWLEAQDILRVK